MTAELHQGDCLEWMKGQPDTIAEATEIYSKYTLTRKEGKE